MNTYKHHKRDVGYLGAATVVFVALLALVCGLVSSAPAQAAPAPKGTIGIKASAKAIGGNRAKTTVNVTLKTTRTTGVRYVDATMYPYTVNAKWQRIQVKWSASKRAYVGKKTWTGASTGKVIAKALGAKNKVVKVKRPATKVTGWKKKATVTAGKALTNTVKVTPAYGRKVVVQVKTNKGWSTKKTYSTPKAAKTAKVKVKLTAKDLTKNSKWRVRVTAGAAAAKNSPIKKVTVKNSAAAKVTVPKVAGLKQAKAVKTIQAAGLKTKVTKVASTAVMTGSVISTNPAAGKKVNKGATVTIRVAITPGTDNDPGGTTACGVDLLSQPIPCATTPSISTVLDRWTINPECGVTQVCTRAPTLNEVATFGDFWTSPPPKVGDLYDGTREDGSTYWGVTPHPTNTRDRTMTAMPDFLHYLNEYRTQQGKAPLAPMPTSVTVTGVTVPGQGGFAQNWAEYLGTKYGTTLGLSANEGHSCSAGRPGTAEKPCYKIGKYLSDDWGATAAANATIYWNENLPLTSGRYWRCEGTENIGGTGSHSAAGAIERWKDSPNPAHHGAMLADVTYASFGGTIARNGMEQITVYTGCVIVESNPVVIDTVGVRVIGGLTPAADQSYTPAP